MKNTFCLLIAVFAIVLCFVGCNDSDNYPSKNILGQPEVIVPDIKENSAVISWKAIGNATIYYYSLNNGAEQSTTETTIQLTGLTPEQSYTFKVKAQKEGSLYFDDSEYTEVTFTTTAHVKIYHIATFADDWDTWYYEYNNNGSIKRVYRLWEGQLDREWVFAYGEGGKVTVTGKNTYEITLNDQGYAVSFKSGTDSYVYSYDENGYMVQVEKNGNIVSNITIENGNIMKWSKFSDGIEQFKNHTYSLIPNVGGAHCIYSEGCGASRWLVETGLFGKASAYCHTSNGWDYSSSSSTFTFEYDENNCIEKESKDYDGYVENFFYTYFVE
ncbi:MAG: DUF4595 domain-containing protein [Bacteroides sp.]|jgi:hypothetical protein|nr:DUF4595 domain-containing protein [Bacteroides sp.]MCI1683425.1 DUF4595 domain-containing protein [Bacteroides sp.]